MMDGNVVLNTTDWRIAMNTQTDVLSIVDEIERALPLLGLQAAQIEWLTGRLNTLRSASGAGFVGGPAPQPAPTPQPDWAQNNQAPTFGAGPGWMVSMGTVNGVWWPNAWVPKNADGTPNWTGIVAEGNTSGPNTGIEGLTYAQMTADQQTAYVAAIKATGAQFT